MTGLDDWDPGTRGRTGSTRPRVAVIGAGIVGAWVAYELARADCNVQLIDAAPLDSSDSASFGNAGILALSYAKPMSNPRTLAAGIRSAFGAGHDVEIARPLSVSTLRWMLQFAVESRPGRAGAAAVQISQAASRSLKMYEEFALREMADLQLRKTGWLYVARSSHSLRRQHALARELRSAGVRSVVVDVGGLSELEPGLAPDLVGGVFYPDDVSMDPSLLTRAVRKGGRRWGVDFAQARIAAHRQTRDGIVTLVAESGQTFEVDQVVIAAGAASREVGTVFGVRIPVEPGVGWSITIPTDGPVAERALMSIEDHVVINPGPASVRITGGMRFGGVPHATFGSDQVAAFQESATRLLPSLDLLSTTEQVWAGARPMSASGLPLVGRVSPTTIVATGHGTLGMTLAPHTAEQVRRLLRR